MAHEALVQALPKVELHVHIEGTLEPELKFKLAQRNGIKLPFSSEQEVKDSYTFDDLASFLDAYYDGMNVLLTSEDSMTWPWPTTARPPARDCVTQKFSLTPRHTPAVGQLPHRNFWSAPRPA